MPRDIDRKRLYRGVAFLGSAMLFGSIILTGSVLQKKPKDKDPVVQTIENSLIVGRLWASHSMLRLNDNSSHRVGSLAFSPDGKLLATGGKEDHTIKLWNAQQGILLQTLVGHRDHIGRVVFSPDSKTLASTSFDRTVRLWDTRTGKLKKILWSKYPYGKADFSSDGKLVVSPWIKKGRVIKGMSTWDRGTNMWDTQTGHLVRSTAVEGAISDGPSPQSPRRPIAVSPDGTMLATSRYGKMKLQDLRTGNFKFKETHLYEIAIDRLAFSPDGEMLAVGGTDYGRDKKGSLSDDLKSAVKLWNVQKGKVLHTLDTDVSAMTTLAFSPNGRLLVISGIIKIGDKLSIEALEIWDMRMNRRSYIVPLGLGSVTIAFSEDSKELAVGQKGRVEIWRIDTVLQ